jgi:Zn-dependent M28 family amino/carboxypeptidase
MTPRSRYSPPFLPILVGGTVVVSEPDWAALGNRWWSHVQVLADDGMEGRDTGSRGYEKAAEYMVNQFRAVGLQPAGADGFRQSMEFDVVKIDEGRCRLEMIRGGMVEPLQLGVDAVIGVSTGSAERLEAEAVFVGYGLAVPELNHDDFAGQDVRGKIVVYVTGGPADMPSSIKAHYQSIEERRAALRKRGVVGTVAIPNPKAIERPWSRVAASRFEPKMELRDPGNDIPAPLPLAVLFNTDRAELLFRGSGHAFQEILDAIQSNRSLPHFPLNVTLRAQVGTTRTSVKSENIVGMLPGSDPELRNEFVVVSAHLDHIGIGEPVNGDRVYSGAMDDASGDASLIEVARNIRDLSARPKRSILFLSVTGEEKGLLGSQYFATHPTVPGVMVADLNMDMYNPLFPLKYLEVQGLDESSLGDDIRKVAETAGVEVQPDQEPEHNLFIRSDQYSFIKKGVPALTFKFSYLPGTPEEKIFKTWLAERYHAPLDDLEQPVDRAAAAQFNSILTQLTLRVADAESRPAWKPKSFFRRFVR